jgi:hypothetical protein
MMKDRKYRRMLEEYGIDDIDEILSKNDYQSPEESDPDNNSNVSTEKKQVFTYKLAWRSKKVTHNNTTVFYSILITFTYLLIFLVN